MDTDRKKLFKIAWRTARTAAAKFGGSSRQYFPQALRDAWELANLGAIQPAPTNIKEWGQTQQELPDTAGIAGYTLISGAPVGFTFMRGSGDPMHYTKISDDTVVGDNGDFRMKTSVKSRRFRGHIYGWDRGVLTRINGFVSGKPIYC